MTEQDYCEEHFDAIELHFIELPKFLATKYDKKRKNNSKPKEWKLVEKTKVIPKEKGKKR